MPIYFSEEGNKAHVEFAGGDIILTEYSQEEDYLGGIGIAEAPEVGVSGASVDYREVNPQDPEVFLTFNTKESLDALIKMLIEHRKHRFEA